MATAPAIWIFAMAAPAFLAHSVPFMVRADGTAIAGTNRASKTTIVDIRKAWRTACQKGGKPGLLFHDLRRSAVKHLDEAGVSRDVAMQISGRKTQSMYTRYNIVNTKRTRLALEQTQTYWEGTTGNVVSISK